MSYPKTLFGDTTVARFEVYKTKRSVTRLQSSSVQNRLKIYNRYKIEKNILFRLESSIVRFYSSIIFFGVYSEFGVGCEKI